MNTLTLLRKRHLACLCIAVALLGLFAIVFYGFEPFAGGVSFEQANEKYTTNCDMGMAGCGSVDLLVISAIIFVLVTVVGFVISLPKRINDR